MRDESSNSSPAEAGDTPILSAGKLSSRPSQHITDPLSCFPYSARLRRGNAGCRSRKAQSAPARFSDSEDRASDRRTISARSSPVEVPDSQPGLFPDPERRALEPAASPASSAEIRWRANDSGSLFFDLSLLPALLNSKYLHDVSPVSDLPSSENRTHICLVALVCIRRVKVSLSHVLCGVAVNEQPDGLYCPFCEVTCQKRCLYSFRFGCVIIDKGNVPCYVWCDGPAAEEVLQISPARYMTLQEEQRQLQTR